MEIPCLFSSGTPRMKLAAIPAGVIGKHDQGGFLVVRLVLDGTAVVHQFLHLVPEGGGGEVGRPLVLVKGDGLAKQHDVAVGRGIDRFPLIVTSTRCGLTRWSRSTCRLRALSRAERALSSESSTDEEEACRGREERQSSAPAGIALASD